jgi:uncharacterized protein YqhQ
MSKIKEVKKEEVHKTKIGGQALFEGVMMRSTTQEAMAVRKKDGSIHVECKPLPPSKWYQKALFIRGVFNFVIQIKNGYKYMMKSMDVSGFLDEEEDESVAEVAETSVGHDALGVPCEIETVADKPEPPPESDVPCEIDGVPGTSRPTDEPAEPVEKSKAFETLIGVVGTVAGVALGIGLFMFVPTYSVNGLNALFAFDLEPYRSIVEGVIRIILFVLYMWAVSLMKEIRTTYQYHGAEHKVIAAFEAGEVLDSDDPECVEKMKTFTRFHPRCGTSFIFLVLAISILIYSILSIPGMPMNVATIGSTLGIVPWGANAVRISIQILSTPFIVAVTYELIKLAGRYDRNPLMRVLSAPGLALQRLTVFEPNDKQIEVAIAAMMPVIPKTEAEKEEDKW